jgi:hypothetical protein
MYKNEEKFNVGDLVTIPGANDLSGKQEMFLILPDKAMYDGYIVALRDGKIKVQLSTCMLENISKVEK